MNTASNDTQTVVALCCFPLMVCLFVSQSAAGVHVIAATPACIDCRLSSDREQPIKVAAGRAATRLAIGNSHTLAGRFLLVLRKDA